MGVVPLVWSCPVKCARCRTVSQQPRDASEVMLLLLKPGSSSVVPLIPFVLRTAQESGAIASAVDARRDAVWADTIGGRPDVVQTGTSTRMMTSVASAPSGATQDAAGRDGRLMPFMPPAHLVGALRQDPGCNSGARKPLSLRS